MIWLVMPVILHVDSEITYLITNYIFIKYNIKQFRYQISNALLSMQIKQLPKCCWNFQDMGRSIYSLHQFRFMYQQKCTSNSKPRLTLEYVLQKYVCCMKTLLITYWHIYCPYIMKYFPRVEKYYLNEFTSEGYIFPSEGYILQLGQ